MRHSNSACSQATLELSADGGERRGAGLVSIGLAFTERRKPINRSNRRGTSARRRAGRVASVLGIRTVCSKTSSQSSKKREDHART